MNCKFKTEFDEICTNGDCPKVGDFCRLSDDCEICVYQDGRNLIKEIAELKAKLETQRQRGQELIIHAMLNKGKNQRIENKNKQEQVSNDISAEG